ncbi:hypothetical protein BKA57DRAFT_263035 [Linnemannia elongata]|nr:hypothetical protein BKA57DRAFT_263035 [Linnemannia elongata]
MICLWGLQWSMGRILLCAYVLLLSFYVIACVNEQRTKNRQKERWPRLEFSRCPMFADRPYFGKEIHQQHEVTASR